MGWDNHDNFSIYSDKKQVYQFDRNKITSISDPTHETDVANT